MNVLAGKLFGVIGTAVQATRENHSNSRPLSATSLGRGFERHLAVAATAKLHRSALC